MLCVRDAGVVARRAAVTWAHILTLHHRLMRTDDALLYRGSALQPGRKGHDASPARARSHIDGVLYCQHAYKIAREVKLEVHRDVVAANAESVLGK
eukprot:6202689-Pleurochrysis_carterae.AAC.1